MAARNAAVDIGRIQQRILLIRGDKVVIDVDLAAFYGVSTRRLNEQVKRNASRFPADFAFRLTIEEKSEVVAKCDHLSVFVVRAFVALRHAVANRGELGEKLAELERRLEHHDGQIRSLVVAIRELMSPAAVPKRRQIGFVRD